MSDYLKLFLKVVVSVSLIWFVLSKIHVQEMIDRATKIDARILGTVLLLYFVYFIVSTYKWKILLPEESFKKLFRFTLVGQFYSLILPGQITGELAKGYRFAGEGNNGAKATASIIVDKVTTFGSMVVLGVIGCIFATIRAPFFIVLIIVSFSLILVVFIYASRFSSLFIKILNIFKIPQKILLKLKMFIDYYNSFYLSYRTLIISILVGMVSQVLLIWLNIIIMHSIGVSIGIFETLWLFAASSFITILPITLGGLGLREGIFAASALSLGIRPTIMVTLSLIVYAFQATFALIGGLLEMLHFLKRDKKVSQLG